ncbi:MAG: hypothetical protein LBP99_03295 [Azoarcus sp.]|jgi:hypothetical protein|nr:hypothetical protein [Azoarcus sp.]
MKPFSSFLLQWLCLLFGLFLSGPASAQAVDAPPAPNDPASVSGQASPAYVAQARKTIDAVLAEPEFDRTRTIKVPQFKNDAFLEWFFKRLSKYLSGNSEASSQSSDLGQFFAQTGQIVLWLLVFGLIALLVVYSKHWLPFFSWRRLRANPLLPLARQSDNALEIAVALPEDIATAAEHCWNEGKKDEALSLLYRGTIELLAERHRVEPPQGATEEEIRLLVSNVLPSFKDSFGNIACAWLRLAYAHRPPADIIGLLAEFRHLQQTGEVVL